KKNPDVAELVRGRSGRLLGDLIAVLTTLKGLPLAYDSDLQEQRIPLYDATSLADALSVLALVVRGLRFDRKAMRRATERGMLAATDLADHLAKRGVPLRGRGPHARAVARFPSRASPRLPRRQGCVRIPRMLRARRPDSRSRRGAFARRASRGVGPRDRPAARARLHRRGAAARSASGF